PISTTVTAVQQELAAIKTVHLPSGQLVILQPLLGVAGTKSLTPTLALTRVQLVLDQLNAAANDNTANRLALLNEILAQPEFNRPLSLWDRFWQWLRSFLPDLDASPVGRGTGTMVRLIVWAIAGIGGILVIFLLSYWLQGLLGNFVTDFEARRRLASGEELPLTATAARQQATTLAAAGNYRDAVRQLYLSALLALEERNLLTYDRSLTNREVLAQLRHQSNVQNHLQPVVETFDNVWYGIQEPDQATFTNYEREIDQLVDEDPAISPRKRPG
ncbi:MAG: DUF4129 domain-containing protein, partial [Chloroflexi bacterium]|nr:DUF4129 domain-containing protein [Chloroflexota bacterium]